MDINTTAAFSLPEPITFDELRGLLDGFQKMAGPDASCTVRVRNRKLAFEGNSNGSGHGFPDAG